VQQLRLFCPHVRKDALYGILSAEKRNYPPQIQSPAQAISRRKARHSLFLTEHLLSLVRF